MPYLTILTIAVITSASVVNAQSNLLESVKRNPEEAIEQCMKFEKLNSNGISASSKDSLAKFSEQKNISDIDAEILSMYIRGLYCPEVF